MRNNIISHNKRISKDENLISPNRVIMASRRSGRNINKLVRLASGKVTTKSRRDNSPIKGKGRNHHEKLRTRSADMERDAIMETKSSLTNDIGGDDCAYILDPVEVYYSGLKKELYEVLKEVINEILDTTQGMIEDVVTNIVNDASKEADQVLKNVRQNSAAIVDDNTNCLSHFQNIFGIPLLSFYIEIWMAKQSKICGPVVSSCTSNDLIDEEKSGLEKRKPSSPCTSDDGVDEEKYGTEKQKHFHNSYHARQYNAHKPSSSLLMELFRDVTCGSEYLNMIGDILLPNTANLSKDIQSELSDKADSTALKNMLEDGALRKKCPPEVVKMLLAKGLPEFEIHVTKTKSI